MRPGSSQVVKLESQRLVRLVLLLAIKELVLVDVVGKLFSVLYACRGLDWPSEAVVAVAELVSEILEINLESLILNVESVHMRNLIVNWKSCSSGRIVVGHHVEVKGLI